MAVLIGTVLVASLAGSLHCAGMCGAFVGFAVGAEPGRGRFVLHAAYNGGRLATYVILGVASGALGAVVDFSGSLAGVQRAAAVLAGAMMVVFGGVAIARLSGVRVPTARLPGRLQRWVSAAHRAVVAWRPVPRALAIGLLTTLLPCGWLYAFAITAAGTASPLWGGLTMVAFWIGTLPVLVSIGIGVQKLLGSVGRVVPVAIAVLIVAVGLHMLLQRGAMPAFAAAPEVRGNSVTSAPATDDHAAIDEAIERVKTLDSEKMPCCQHDGG